MLFQALMLIFILYVLASAVRLIMDNRSPQSTWAWLLTFILFPVIGLVVYLFIGRSWKAFSKQKRLARQKPGHDLTDRLQPYVGQQKEIIEGLRTGKNAAHRKRLLELLYNNCHAVLTTHNQVEILQNADEKYPRLLRDLRQAQHSIHMQYYIWAADEFTEEVKAILVEKVKAGVEVRVLYDALGSGTAMAPSYVLSMRDAGIEIYPYLYTSRIHNIGYRNHRKIVVVDNNIAYMGGLNLSQEHIDGGKSFPAWRDTHLRIVGESVAMLQSIFMVEWFNTTEQKLTQEKYLNSTKAPESRTPVQIVASGPDSEWLAIHQLYFFMIMMAEKEVLIQSPFFILDPIMNEAIRTAALSGVEVKIMLAPSGGGKGVFNLNYDVANTFCADVVKAGAQVYFFPQEKGYFHPKTLCIDRSLCSIGTANMDIRSFSINYEVNAVLYDENLAQKLAADFHQDLQGCTKFDLEAYNNRSNFSRFKDSFYRLFSPLM